VDRVAAVDTGPDVELVRLRLRRHQADSEKVSAVKKQLNDLRSIQREMQAIMNETKDQLTREQTQSAVKDKKLQKCYEMIQVPTTVV
jgi:hypothetical protein